MSKQEQSQNFIDFRKRRSYTLEEKLEIIRELESGVKQAQVAESKRIAASTVQNIWSTRDRVLRDYRRVRNHSLRKIPRNPRSSASGNGGSGQEYGSIDKALMQWYTGRKRFGGMTVPIIKAKALQISKQFGHYDFKATSTWFTNWTTRYGVTLPKSETRTLNGNNGISVKEIFIPNETGNNDQEQDEESEDIGLWPVTVTYGEDEEEQLQQEGDDLEIVDPSAFLVQDHQEPEISYPDMNKPIREMRNGVEVIYRTRGSRGGRYKSYIWKYFREQEEEVDGGSLRYVECVFCNNRVSPKAGRMEKHLQSCEFCPPEISQTELGLGTEVKQNRSLQNIISSTMDGIKEESRDEAEADMMEEEMIEEDDESGNQNSNQSSNQQQQEQEASSSNGPPVSILKKRRTFHWKRIATYKNVEEAELALGDLSMWSRKHKHRTQQGIKTYYGCKFGRNCPVQMHLLFETRTKRVIMFQTTDDHCHVSKLKKRGLPQEAEKPIRQLYNEGITKPSHIQQALDEDGGIDVPPRYQIAYFLDKIRREESGSLSGNGPGSPIKPEAGETITLPGYGSDLMSNWYDESHNGGDDSGEVQILPYFDGTDGSADDGSEEPVHNWTEYPVTTSTNSTTIFNKSTPESVNSGENSKLKEDTSVYSAINTTAGNGMATVTVTEVHSLSTTNPLTASQIQTYPSFRDETTKDGDIIAPGEQNVKRRVINFIEKNFSNRDFLQIHRELQSLKDAQKFTSLIRLASFTAGFLQTAFLDQQYETK